MAGSPGRWAGPPEVSLTQASLQGRRERGKQTPRVGSLEAKRSRKHKTFVEKVETSDPEGWLCERSDGRRRAPGVTTRWGGSSGRRQGPRGAPGCSLTTGGGSAQQGSGCPTRQDGSEHAPLGRAGGGREGPGARPQERLPDGARMSRGTRAPHPVQRKVRERAKRDGASFTENGNPLRPRERSVLPEAGSPSSRCGPSRLILRPRWGESVPARPCGLVEFSGSVPVRVSLSTFPAFRGDRRAGSGARPDAPHLTQATAHRRGLVRARPCSDVEVPGLGPPSGNLGARFAPEWEESMAGRQHPAAAGGSLLAGGARRRSRAGRASARDCRPVPAGGRSLGCVG